MNIIPYLHHEKKLGSRGELLSQSKVELLESKTLLRIVGISVLSQMMSPKFLAFGG